MNAEQALRDKLRKIEALFAGAATVGEKAAAGAAAERIRERLGRASGKEKPEEMRFSIPDAWSRQLFIALCRRYGLCPFRHRRMHRQTIVVEAPKSFVEQVLWPEFRELSAAWPCTSPKSPRKSFAKKSTATPARPTKSTSRRGSGDEDARGYWCIPLFAIVVAASAKTKQTIWQSV